jgi:small-conductance mechanosensitive channel
VFADQLARPKYRKDAHPRGQNENLVYEPTYTHLAALGRSSSARSRSNLSRHTLLAVLVLSLILTVVVCLVAQPSRDAQSQNPTHAAAQLPTTSTAVVISAHADSTRIIHFLDQIIAWHRQLGAQEQMISDVTDSIYVSSNRRIADEIARLAFQFARTEADDVSQPAQTQPPGEPGTTAAAYQTLRQQEGEALRDQNEVEDEVESLQKKLAGASGRQKQALQAQLGETQAEVDLAKARVDALRNMARFMTGAGSGATGLSAQIDALESTLPPELRVAARGPGSSIGSGGANRPPASSQPAAPAPAAVRATNEVSAGSGLWASATILFATWGKLQGIDTDLQQTLDVTRSAQDIRNPLVTQMSSLLKRGDELAHQADTADASTLEREKQQLNATTQQFKQLTAATMPLAQADILLGLYQKNLASWHDSVTRELWTQSRGFFARLIGLGVIIALVLGASELWRRAISKYIRDPRRRWQLHWMRKFVVWGVIGTIVTVSLVSQIGSIATFAGLITAGLAVSLQNVIQSIVGYFFLIGKYGIRAGDRVMIGGVSGEVIDVGLVRIHLMEMGGAGADTPTGRVVAFSNSIVFQATPGLFKQIPGTSFTWHEITLTLPSDTNFPTARERLLKSVEAGLAEYKDEISRQHSAMEDAFQGGPGVGLQPTVQLQFTSSGLEAVVRYPVALRHAMEIDERITRAILADFDFSHSASPAFRLKTAATA